MFLDSLVRGPNQKNHYFLKHNSDFRAQRLSRGGISWNRTGEGSGRKLL